jgi:hypothetical protein
VCDLPCAAALGEGVAHLLGALLTTSIAQAALSRADTLAADRRTFHLYAAVGRTGDTQLTGFTDGCPGLRSILAAAGVASRFQ